MQHKGLRLAVEKDGLCQMCRTTEMTFKEVGKESVSRSKLHVWSLRSNHRQLGESDCQASGGMRSLHASLVHGECGECVAVCWRELQSRIQSALDQPCSCAYLHSQPGNLYSEAAHMGICWGPPLIPLSGVLQLKHFPPLCLSAFLFLFLLFAPTLWAHRKAREMSLSNWLIVLIHQLNTWKLDRSWWNIFCGWSLMQILIFWGNNFYLETHMHTHIGV